MVQLELGKFGVKKPPAGEQGRKALLKNCLRSAADLIRRAQLYLEFPEVMPRTVNGTGHTGPSPFCAIAGVSSEHC